MASRFWIVSMACVFACISVSWVGSPAVAQTIINVTATPNNSSDDDRPAIQAALSQAKMTPGNVKIVFPSGTYHLKTVGTSGAGDGYALSISKDTTGTLEVAGAGSTFMLMYPQSIRGSGFARLNNLDEQLFMHDFTIDIPNNYLPWTEGTIVQDTTDTNPATVLIQVRSGYPTPDGTWLNTGMDHWGYILDDTIPGRIRYNTFNANFADGPATAVNVGGNTHYKFTFSGNQATTERLAQFVPGRRFTYLVRGGSTFYATNCADLRFGNITIYAGAGPHFNLFNCDSPTLNNCNISIKSGRWKAGNGGGFILNDCPGFRLSNSSVEGAGDDCTNFTGDDIQGPAMPWNFLVDQCTFKNSRREGLLIKAWGGIVRNCTVEGISSAGISIWNGQAGEPWYAGDLTLTDITVDRCSFEANGHKREAPVTIWDFQPNGTEATANNLNRRITFDFLTIKNAAAPLVYIGNSTDVTLKNSVLTKQIAGSPPLVARNGNSAISGIVHVNRSNIVNILDNRATDVSFSITQTTATNVTKTNNQGNTGN